MLITSRGRPAAASKSRSRWAGACHSRICMRRNVRCIIPRTADLSPFMARPMSHCVQSAPVSIWAT
eukprot:343332-Pyramimonas_sp.AAC.1